ncbi:VCBS domain-containing protein, partial [Cloacibacillus evryensis]
YKYDLNNTDPNVQALRVGQTVTDTFDVVITDEHGAAATETLTITITGTNDAPKISLTGTDHDSAALTETNASLTESGTLTLSDIDVKDAVSTVKVDSIVKGGTYGGTLPTDGVLKDMLSISDGSLTDSETGGKINWNFNSGSAHFDFLAAGETLTLTYTVKSTDNSGTANDNDIHEITITITGTNDAPVITGTSSGAVTETDADHLTDNGTLTLTDADFTDTVTVSVDKVEGYTALAGKGAPTLEEVKNMLTVAKAGEITYGSSAEVVASGETGAADNLLWKFDTGDATFDYLKKGETVTLKYTLTAEDSSGAKATQVVTVTVTGTNDTPVLTVNPGDGDSASAPGLTESAAALTATGNISVSDEDIKDTISENIIDSVKTEGSTAGLTLSEAQLRALLTLNTTGLTDANDSGKLEWKFDNTGNTHAFDYLKEGETLTITYDVKVKDSSGQGAASGANEADTSNIVPITITITGTNSAPALADDTNSVTEDNGLLNGTIPPVETASASVITAADTDADYNGKDAWLITSAKETSAAGSTAVAAGGTAADVAGKYGTLHIKADGSYTYTLSNSSDQIQQLGHDGSLADEFSVTVTDGSLTATQTLTINIGGTNDKPTIGVAAGTGDSAAADVIEGNIDPSVDKAEATGTLTFSDIDLGDTVTVTKLALSDADFTISGPQDGLISTRAELYDMLTLTDTTFTTAGGTNSHQLTWTFESGDERFNYLKADETLTLTYKVQAKDDSGITANDTSKTQNIVITIKGSDSATGSNPSPDTGTVAEDKTLTVSGHHGTSGANQNLLYNDDSDGAIASFKVKGDDTQYGVGKDVDVKIGDNTIGTINIKANGDYTFTPVKNYSGPVPQITYTTSDGKTSTLDITVTPVADKPTWETPAPSTDGTEDAKIAMNLKLPTITDAKDLNGAGTGDHPERLGYITLENIGKATVYYNGDNGDTALTAIGGKITIAIVNDEGALDTNLHYTGLDISGTNIVKLTQAQFEALTIQQEADSGKNITGLKLSVTSYETNDSGVPISGLDGATGTKTFNVNVLAVTDATPDVKLGGSNSTPTESDLTTAITDGHITITDTQGTATGTISAKTEGGSGAIVIEEDCTMKIDADYLKASVSSTDTDGSEKYVVTVSGLAAGSVVNGVTAGADGTVTLTAETSVKSGSIDIFTSGLTITPPENFSGKMDGVTIKVETYDTDGDSSGTIAHNTAEMTLPVLVVTPVVDGVDTLAVKQAVGNEDEPIALHIKPSCSDGSETFNVKIEKIPDDAKITYDGTEYTAAGGSVTINGFDSTKPLTVTPPLDSNADFKLTVTAQTVESDGSQSAWSTEVDLAVTVHSVADPVTVYDTMAKPLTYTETQAEANGIKLGKLIVKADDNTDGSEQVTLTVTNLAPEFTLAGSAVEFKGGEGTGRTWLVTMKQGVDLENTDAYIKTPANFSGKIEFSAQATNTDSTQDGTPDSSTSVSQVTNVAITVTPTPEATVNLSGAANEDALQQLSFAIQYQNGDTDETLSAIYIKASEVDAGHDKNFSVLYSEDGGKTTMTLQEALNAGKITIDGDFYKITSTDGNDVDKIFVKGNAEYSGTGNALTVKYAVTDEAYTGEGTHTISTPVTTVSGDTNYGITFKPVTDPTTMKAVDTGDITVDGSAITLSGTTVTVGAGNANSFSVDITVNAPADVDGSEHFIKLIVDGVPDGVSVKGATYLGDSGAAVGTGRWLLTVDDGKFFDSSHGFTTKLDFTVDRGNPNIWGLHGEDAVKVTVTAVSQDEMGSMKGDEAESSTTAEFGIKIGFDGTDPAHADIPAPGINITKGTGTVEDSGECTLGHFIKAEYQIDTAESHGQTEYRFSFEINGLPEGTVVSGDAVKGGSVTITADGGVTVSGFGDEEAMQYVLDNVKVTLPPNYNNNSGGDTADGMNLNVTWKTDGWDLNGGDGNVPVNNGNVQVVPEVKPVTDPMEITIVPASGTINENQPGEAGTFSFTVSVGEGNDGGYGNVLNEGKLFLKLDGAGESGAITYGDKTYPLTDVADGEYSGITAGKYYVIDGVSAGNELTLAYRPADYYSGNIKVTATIVSQETGAANVIAASGNSELTVNPVNSAYNFTVDDAAANENGTANLTISPSGGHDADGSEKIHSVVLSGVDAAYRDDFIVKYTVDGAEKTAAKVAAGTDAEGNQLYEWVLSTDSAGNLPIGIKITGLNHYSGTQNLTMTVVTGETALGTGKENSYGFSLTFHPTADGFSDFTPTLTFGKAGEYIDLNLNAMVNDTSDTGSETATVTLKGLGDGASFFIEDGGKYNSVTTAYDAANKTYTLSGIALDEINDIKILSPNVGKTNVTVDAWTVEPGAQDSHKESAHISADVHCGNKFDITVSAAAPTSGADRLIYGGAAGTYDGGGGTDTLYLANFRETANSAKNDIDFEAAATIKNIEIIDMSDGAHSLTKVTAEAVKNMTDANNTLRIMGGNDDKIELSGGWVKDADTSSDGWRTYTNGEATINVDGDVNVTINGIDAMSLMMAMAFAPLAAAAEPAIMPDSLAGYDFSSDFGAAAASGSPAFSLTAEGMIDFSSLTHSSFGTLDMENASAQSLYHVDPYGVYGVTDGSHELTVTGTELDSVSLADAPDAHWGTPELSADGSHYSYTATGDFDHDAATPDETVTLNVSRAIYGDTLAYDAHAMNDGGLGDDTLTFGHEDSTVDFSGGAASHIANIERFDLGEGDHSLENITAKDVFNMTDARGTLTINGDNADHVTLSDVLDDATDGMWESSPFQSVESGVSYSVYTGSFEGHMVTLKIEDEIIQQLTTHTKG